MAYSLQIDKLEDDGTIRVRHIFFGESEEECEQAAAQHGEGCKAFGPAIQSGRVIQLIEEIDEIPEWQENGGDS